MDQKVESEPPKQTGNWHTRLCRELDHLQEHDRALFTRHLSHLPMTKAHFLKIRSGDHMASVSEIQSIVEVFSLNPEYIFMGVSQEQTLDDIEFARWKSIAEQLQVAQEEVFVPQKNDLGVYALRVLDRVGDLGYSIVMGEPNHKNYTIATTMPQEWYQRYVQEGFVKDDPVVIWAVQNYGVISWDDLSPNRRGKMIMQEARKAGLRHGTIMVTQVLGQRCCLSLIHTQERISKSDLHSVRQAVNVIVASNTKPNPFNLTPDLEKLVYHYADGLGDEAIARKLGVTSRTLRNWKTKLMNLTQSTSLVQAVCKTIGSGSL